MTAIRPYKEKRTKKDAINELLRCKGKQFDPHIVDLFVKDVLMKK